MKRELRFFDVLCIGVNAIIGSGIFLFPGKLASHLGPASILAFLVCGILLIPIATCYSTLAARYEATGGVYLYARDAFGPWIGFGVGWMGWVMLVFSFAAVANAVSSYLGHFSAFFSTFLGTKIVACSVIVFLGVLNYLGVRPAAYATDFFTVAKLLPLLLFVGVGIFYVDWGQFAPFAPRGFSGMGPALFLAYFALQGFENVPVPSGEILNPQRSAPLAVALSLLICGFLYVLVQVVAVGTYPGLAGSSKPLAEAGESFLGRGGAGFIAAGAALSTIGYTTGAALVCPRVLYALGRDGFIPRVFSTSHARFGTPHVAIAFTTGVAALAAFFLDFQKLVDLSNVTVATQYAAACGAAWMLGGHPLPQIGEGPVDPPTGMPLGRKGYPEGRVRVAVVPPLPQGEGRVRVGLMPLLGLGVTVYLSSQASFAEFGAALAALAAGYAGSLSYRRFFSTPTIPLSQGERG